MRPEQRKLASLFLTLLLGAFLLFRMSREIRSIDWSKVNPSCFPGVFLLGLMAFLSYTAVWYFLLSGYEGVSFKKLLTLNLVGSYLSMTLNSALGGIVKARYTLPNWWGSIGVVALATVLEILPGTLVAVFSGDSVVLPGLILLLWALLHEDSLYQMISVPFRIFGKDEWIHNFYLGWKGAKSNRNTFLRALAVSPLQSIFLSLALVLTGKAFGVSIPLWSGFIGVTYSTVLGGLVGTPGGIGGNELGVILAIGDVSTAATMAFIYKFFTQYIFAILGAVPFYRMIGADLLPAKGEGSA